MFEKVYKIKIHQVIANEEKMVRGIDNRHNGAESSQNSRRRGSFEGLRV